MTPTTYGRDFAYCLKSHGGVRGFNASLWRFLLRCTLFCHSVATFLTSVSSYEGGCGFEAYDKTEKYMRLLVDMSWLELKVLSVLNSPANYNEKVGNVIKNPNEGNFIGFGIGTRSYNHIDILVKLLNESQDEIRDALYFLQSNRLIVEQSNAIRSQANVHPIHILDNMLTTKGKDFVSFVLNSPSN